MNTKAELIRKLKTLSFRIYYEKNGIVYSGVFSGSSELEILLNLQNKGIGMRDIRGVEEARRGEEVNRVGRASSCD